VEFDLRKYLKEDGTFDYEKYRNIQIAVNKKKIKSVWVYKENVIFLSDYIKTLIPSPQFGICHGSRNGKEQKWFRECLQCEVIGTEISDTAKDFPHTIQWDFHDIKPEWIDNVDFIYTNSFDHTYDPEKCLNAWMSCLRGNGICIIEHSSIHGPDFTSKQDPFGADLSIMPYLITIWADGKYGVRQILTAPKQRRGTTYHNFIVIQNFRKEE